MGPAFIFQISNLNKKFGQRELLKNINLAFYPDSLYVIVGLKGPEPDVRAYEIRDGQVSEAELQVG